MFKLKVFLSVAFVVLIAFLVFFFTRKEVEKPKPELNTNVPVVEDVVVRPFKIGASVQNRSIEAYTYGKGDENVLIVGGIHGGYEWNSTLLAYTFIDYFEKNEATIPLNLSVTIIPSLNPDGLYKVTNKEGRFSVTDIPDESSLPVGTGRFNSNNVDLNRNFDCKWQPKSTWRGEVVDAGQFPFSEPEARALKYFVNRHTVVTAIFLHSQSDAVYASECYEGVLPTTVAVMNAYAQTSDYKAIETFDAYPITGDAEGWLASINIPAITVELATHESIEWDRNLRGVTAVLSLLSE